MLLLLACMFSGNHVAARFALDHGVDVATAVAFFAAPDAAYVTGQVLSVSGGLTMVG